MHSWIKLRSNHPQECNHRDEPIENMAVFSNCTAGSNRLEEAKTFYDALLGSAGITPLFEHPSGGRVYGKDGGLSFGVRGPADALAGHSTSRSP